MADEMSELRGLAASPGIAIGPALRLTLSGRPDPRGRHTGSRKAIAHESHRLDQALVEAVNRLGKQMRKAGDEFEGLLLTQYLLLDDPELHDGALALIKQGSTAEAAVSVVHENHAGKLAALPDPHLAARAEDVREVARRLIAALRGEEPPARVRNPAVLVAAALGSGELLQVGRTRVLGLITESGAPGGHLAIVAQAMGIPAVVGVTGALSAIASGAMVIVDGDRGEVRVHPDPQEVAQAEARRAAFLSSVPSLIGNRLLPGATADGVPIAVYANVGSAEEAKLAASEGAEGIGLFRTELLAIHGLPDEEAQVEAYRQVASQVAGPTVVRLFDFGGDKPLPGATLAPEPNPFLGQRGLRLALQHTERLLLPQLRAVLRAAADHDLRLLLPMVVDPDEVLAVRRLLEQEAADLGRRGVAWRAPELGVMVETPAAALTLERFVRLAQFASIGTNDLAQYVYAADRGNPQVMDRLQPYGVALLRLIQIACRAPLPISVCGQVAADEEAIPLLVGLGVRALSVPPSQVQAVKNALSQRTLSEMRKLAERTVH